MKQLRPQGQEKKETWDLLFLLEDTCSGSHEELMVKGRASASAESTEEGNLGLVCTDLIPLGGFHYNTCFLPTRK